MLLGFASDGFTTIHDISNFPAILSTIRMILKKTGMTCNEI